MTLEDEAERLTKLLFGKVVRRGVRHCENEVLIEFTDGTRFFADTTAGKLELSITLGGEES